MNRSGAAMVAWWIQRCRDEAGCLRWTTSVSRAIRNRTLWHRVRTRILITLAMLLICETALSQEVARPQSRYSVTSDESRLYVADRWGTVRLRVSNAGDEPGDFVLVAYFQSDSRTQYARQLRVPAGSIRTSWLPLRMPGDIAEAADRVEVKTIFMRRSHAAEGEPLLVDDSGLVVQEILLPLQVKRPTTGIIADANDEESIAAVVAMRLDRGLIPRRLVQLGDPLPPTREALDGLDQLVVMSDRLATDSLGLAAIRSWVEGGGRLWIMLDQVTPDTVSLLLGDAFDVHTVGRVRLMEFMLTLANADDVRTGSLRQRLANPVDMVRVFAPHAEILWTIDDWPAAFLSSLGNGTVLFTTLGGRGWLRPRTDDEQFRTDPLKSVGLVSTSTFSEVALRFFAEDYSRPQLRPSDFRSFVSEQIGYETIDRKIFALIGGGFCVGLAGLSLFLARRHQIARLGWMGPLMAMCCAVALILLGKSSRQSVPNTVASAEFVTITPETNGVEITGLLALYNQRDTPAELGAQRGGVILPDTHGEARRMTWTDLDKWHYEGLTLPAGVTLASARYSGTLELPIEARATFAQAGIEGRITSGALNGLADAVLAMPGGRCLAAQFTPEGGFTATAEDALVAGEYISARLPSDEQRRRQEVYRSLFDSRPDASYPRRPTLLVWTAPYETQFKLAAKADRKGASLFAIPLKFDRPKFGTRLTIPAVCVGYESVGAAAAYDNERQSWISHSGGQQTLLRFHVPPSVREMQIERALLTVLINAPSRTLEITAGSTVAPIELKTIESPVGTVRYEIDRPEALVLDEIGGLVLGLDVSDAAGVAQGEPSAPWSISSLSLELTGEMTAPTEE